MKLKTHTTCLHPYHYCLITDCITCTCKYMYLIDMVWVRAERYVHVWKNYSCIVLPTFLKSGFKVRVNLFC